MCGALHESLLHLTTCNSPSSFPKTCSSVSFEVRFDAKSICVPAEVAQVNATELQVSMLSPCCASSPVPLKIQGVSWPGSKHLRCAARAAIRNWNRNSLSRRSGENSADCITSAHGGDAGAPKAQLPLVTRKTNKKRDADESSTTSRRLALHKKASRASMPEWVCQRQVLEGTRRFS